MSERATRAGFQHTARNTCLLTAGALLLFAAGCETGDGATGDADKLSLALEPVQAYFASGDKPTISASDIYSSVIEGKDATYMLVDVRTAEHFAAGHVEGAVNIPYDDWKSPSVLEKLPAVDAGKKVLIFCYTGHKASMLTLFLRQLGYEAYTAKFGMMGWTRDAAVIGKETYCQKGGALELGTVAIATASEGANPLPTVETEAEGEAFFFELIANHYAMTAPGLGLTAQDLHDQLAAGVEGRPLVLDLRDVEDYEAGHIEGAVVIPYKQIPMEENLKKLPRDRTIVVVCYTGHKASQILMLLRQLGYKATVLKYGMMGWVSDTKIIGSSNVCSCSDNYEIVK
jgi:sulfur-carrier protein adenylyltransferase/sulfurtransferase